MDLASHRVRRNGHELHLGPTEFKLLWFFLQSPGRVFSRERILDRVWGQDVSIELRTVDVHIAGYARPLMGIVMPTLSARCGRPDTLWTFTNKLPQRGSRSLES